MRTFRFFRGIKLIALIFLISCGHSNRSENAKKIEEELKHPNDYAERINNIFPYVQKIGFGITFKNCNSIYILQPNLCNVCTRETLKTIMSNTKNETEPVIFILGDKNPEMKLFIKKMDASANIYVDSSNTLEKYNLFFLKNLKINTCDNKVIKWEFL